MSRKLITLEELRQYCLDNSIYSFKAKEEGDSLLVSVPATFSGKSSKETSDDEQVIYLDIKACHTGENKNKSFIADETMEKALPSFAMKPILASIIETVDEDGNTTLDFNGHDMEIGKDKMNPDKERINYIEQIVGVISPENIRMEKEPDSDRQYVYATGMIYKEYTYAADILEQRQDVECSVELCVSSLSLNAKSGLMVIDEFKFSGISLLGASVSAAMSGSHASIQDFSLKNNLQYSISDNDSLMEEFKQAIQKFNDIVSQIPNKKEGGTMNKFEELLAQYNVTAEDVTFEHEGLSDEELEAAFAEAFASEPDDPEPEPASDPEPEPEQASDPEPEDPEPEPAADPEPEPEPDPEPASTEDYSVKYSVEMNGVTRTFELSLDERICALSELVNTVYAEADNTYYGVTVYDCHVVMHDYWTGRHYAQGYSEDEGVFTLIGDREEVFAEFVTADEQATLDEMRANYSALVEFKSNIEQQELHSQREAILNDEKYSMMSEDEGFKSLYSRMDEYSLEDLTKEVKILHSDYVSAHPETVTFSQNKETKPRRKVAYGMEFSTDENKKPYGTLFD